MRMIAMNPQNMKRVNTAHIRSMLRLAGNATRAEIAEQINVSTTTVRSLLCEMRENREILVIGQDTSSGGRRAERYQLNPDRFYGAAFCIGDTAVRYFVLNLFGEIAKEGSFPFAADALDATMTSVLEAELPMEALRAVCVGVPGIVVEDGYLWENSHGELKKRAVGNGLRERLGVPVALENDLNLITAGMGRGHQRMHPQEPADQLNLGYIQFEKDCVSAGFLSGGRLVRGGSNYAGELGILPVGDGRSLVQALNSAVDIGQYARTVAMIVKWVALILNPGHLTLGGPAFRREAMGAVAKRLCAEMPGAALPEIRCADDTWNDYMGGLTALCVDLMFDSLSSIGEPR